MSDLFYNICLNWHVLAVCIINRSDYFGDDPEFNPSNYRKAAHRQYIMYQHGYFGSGNRSYPFMCCVEGQRYISCIGQQLLRI